MHEDSHWDWKSSACAELEKLSRKAKARVAEKIFRLGMVMLLF